MPVTQRAGRRRSAVRDEGAVTVLVAILLATGVLIGMCVLTVDVGLVYAERRELQNGADAAALAVAGSCATTPAGCGTSSAALAGTYADLNARDGAAAAPTVCGSGAGLPSCPPATGAVLTRCSAAAPTGATGWVEVRTVTETPSGQGLLPPAFAQALAGGGAGVAVHACARASWGPPASIVATPITISRCEWDSMTSTGTDFAPPPPYGSSYPSSYERAIYLHNTTGASKCPSHAGSGGDLPGGFGWLEGPGCTSVVTATGTATAGTGASEWNDCKSTFAAIAAAGGGLVYVPVYSEVTKSFKQYTFDGFAAFYLTGWALPSKDQASVATGRKYCRGSDWCLYGWFTEALVPVGDVLPSTGSTGTPRGADAPPRLVG
jgi:Flp pilus assembly protein TadG